MYVCMYVCMYVENNKSTSLEGIASRYGLWRTLREIGKLTFCVYPSEYTKIQ